MKDIPVHKLQNEADAGLIIRHTGDDNFRVEANTMSAHRDDHYLFLIITTGTVFMMVDFNEIIIPAHSIYFILPGQVHHRMHEIQAEGWFIAADTSLIPNDFRAVFENNLLLQQSYVMDDQRFQQCMLLVRLLAEQYSSNRNGAFYLQLVNSLLNSFLGFAACGYLQQDTAAKQTSRPVQIAQQFKQLLAANIKNIKQPSGYAGLLNITESYLNEAIKKVTGFSVSYWILKEVMLEAKRLLYYSELTVKQVAHQLGYDDHAYFSRLFKKANDITPLMFRDAYRK